VIAKTFLDYLLNIQPQSLLKVKISRWETPSLLKMG
jgi:hypothetical protein